jgi:hypothetical protein
MKGYMLILGLAGFCSRGTGLSHCILGLTRFLLGMDFDASKRDRLVMDTSITVAMLAEALENLMKQDIRHK